MSEPGAGHVLVVSDGDAVASAGARLWADAVRHALAARGVFHVALAGGQTPAALYRAVTHMPDLDFAWHRTHVWWGDERAVAPDDPNSNYAMADESLLDRVPIPPGQVHRMPADVEDLDAAARAYAATLAAEISPSPHAPPALDLVWLGVGEDGHVASLFPGSGALRVRDRWVAAVTDAAKGPARRLTLTLPVIDAARRVVIVATGRTKAAIVAQALEGARDAERLLPVQVVRPAPGRLVWLLDEDAASKLTRTPGRAGV